MITRTFLPIIFLLTSLSHFFLFARFLGPWGVSMFDLDLTGSPDIITAVSGANNVQIVYNTGGGAMALASFAACGQPRYATGGDVNGDAYPVREQQKRNWKERQKSTREEEKRAEEKNAQRTRNRAPVREPVREIGKEKACNSLGREIFNGWKKQKKPGRKVLFLCSSSLRHYSHSLYYYTSSPTWFHSISNSFFFASKKKKKQTHSQSNFLDLSFLFTLFFCFRTLWLQTTPVACVCWSAALFRRWMKRKKKIRKLLRTITEIFKELENIELPFFFTLKDLSFFLSFSCSLFYFQLTLLYSVSCRLTVSGSQLRFFFFSFVFLVLFLDSSCHHRSTNDHSHSDNHRTSHNNSCTNYCHSR